MLLALLIIIKKTSVYNNWVFCNIDNNYNFNKLNINIICFIDKKKFEIYNNWVYYNSDNKYNFSKLNIDISTGFIKNEESKIYNNQIFCNFDNKYNFGKLNTDITNIVDDKNIKIYYHMFFINLMMK